MPAIIFNLTNKRTPLIGFLIATLPSLTFAAEPICDIGNTKKIYLQLDTDGREVRTKFFRNLDWPPQRLVAVAASNSAFLIAQHAVSDLPFMQMAFGHIEAGCKAGERPEASYAKIAARILMLRNKPQTCLAEHTIGPSN